MAKLSDYYKFERDRVEHDVKVYDLSAAQELEKWNELMRKFSYDSMALMDIQEKIADSTKRMWEEAIAAQEFALEMGYIGEEEYYSWLAQYRDMNFEKWSDEYNAATLELKKYSDTFYDDAVAKLDEYEAEFDAWYTHSVRMGKLSVDEQIAAQERFANNYNAMVSEIVATAQFGADETKSLWDKAYEIRRGSEESIYSLSGDRKSDIYERWKSDMQGWIDIHNTYGDWEEVGDSLVSVYDRAIVRQKEFYDAGIIGWQEWRDESMKYSLLLYEAASDEYDSILKDYADEISELEKQFSTEITQLRESWEVEDRKADLSEIRDQIDIYKNAVTSRGKEHYADLLEQEKKLEREEQIYALEVRNSKIIDEMQEEYKRAEAAKEKVLAGIRSAELTTSAYTGDMSGSLDEIKVIAGSMSGDYAKIGTSTLNMLTNIYSMLGSIQSRMGNVGPVYNDSRNISIASGVSTGAVMRLINGSIVSGLGMAMY